MGTCVCVISKSGERLMPTFRLGKVRHLLKDGKAKIVKHHPFTIQLKYNSENYTQPVEICEDVGYECIGISVKSQSREYVSAQYDTLKDEKERHDNRRKYRHNQRNRLRYRKPRFNNRKRQDSWLAPSLEHKKWLNISLIDMYCAIIPIKHITVEVGSFNIALLKAIQEGKEVPEGVNYHLGPRYKMATLREAVFYRDNYTCKICGRSTVKDKAILFAHHMFYWKGRHGCSPNELITVCEKCHTPTNHKKGGKLFGFGKNLKFADLSSAAFMNAVRWQIVNKLRNTYGKEFVSVTYGAMTKEQRRLLNIEKSHNNDAYAMGKYHPSNRCSFEHYIKNRRNNRILERFYDAVYIDLRTGKKATGQTLFNGRISRNRNKSSENLHKYRQRKVRKGHRALRRKTIGLYAGDIVSLNGELLIVHGTHTNKKGNINVQFEVPSKSGKKSIDFKKLKVIKTKKNYISAWQKN